MCAHQLEAFVPGHTGHTWAGVARQLTDHPRDGRDCAGGPGGDSHAHKHGESHGGDLQLASQSL